MGTRPIRGSRRLVLLLLPSLLAACGEEGPPPDEQTEVKTFVEPGGESSTEGDAGVEGTGSEAPVSLEEARTRERLRTLRRAFREAGDSMARAEVLAEIAAEGGSAEPLMDLVRKGCKDEDPFTRMEAVKAAAAVAGADARGLLLEGLQDSDEDVRLQAVLGWRRAEIRDLGPLLDRLAAEMEVDVQRAVGQVVLELGTKALAPRVAQAMELVNLHAAAPFVRYFGTIKATGRVDLVLGYLDRDNRRARAAAAEALGELGVDSREVLQGLVQALEDEDSKVRKAAVEALRSLTGKTHGFEPGAGEAERAAAVEAWRTWLKQKEDS